MSARLALIALFAIGLAGCLTKSESNIGGEPPPSSSPPPPASDTVTLTLSISGSGVVRDGVGRLSCATSCSAQVSPGTNIVLSAIPDSGFTFGGWSGACNGAGDCTITVSQATSIAAGFSPTSSSNPSGDSLFVAPDGPGAVSVTLHPGSQVVRGQTTKVAFGVPFPKGFVSTTDLIRIVDTSGNELASSVTELTRWRTIPVGGPESLRAALVYVDVVFSDLSPMTLRVEYGTARSLTLAGTQPAVQSLWTSISNGPSPDEYPAADDVREPIVYVTMPAQWLSQALIVTRTTPTSSSASLNWFDEAFVNYARTAVNDVASTVLPENLIDLSGSEPWLYDRALSLFSVYVRTGDITWLRRAHRAAQWYSKNVDANGIFTRASYNHDLKYSYGLSLLTDYILTGDNSLAAPIDRVAQAGIREWQTTYSASEGFWTERHHTYAILAALSSFEMTGRAEDASRATSLVNLILQMSENVAHCPLHTVEQHEGDAGDTRLMCSPWMGALLANAMLRYYMLSEDPNVLTWLSGMGDFVRQYAAYDGGIENAELAGRIMPWYLVGPAGQVEDGRGWGDMEHACDVAGLVAKGVWAKRRLGLDHTGIEATADDLLSTCSYVLDYWHRSAPQLAEYRLSPPRKFSWWFGSSTDIAWMLSRQ